MNKYISLLPNFVITVTLPRDYILVMSVIILLNIYYVLFISWQELKARMIFIRQQLTEKHGIFNRFAYFHFVEEQAPQEAVPIKPKSFLGSLMFKNVWRPRWVDSLQKNILCSAKTQEEEPPEWWYLIWIHCKGSKRTKEE